jgi:hypothetical protein
MRTARDQKLLRPWQFSMKTLVLLPVYSVTCVAVLLAFSCPRTKSLGIGHTSITLHFVVLDSATSSPIPGAALGLYDADLLSILEKAETSGLGKSQITRDFSFSFIGGDRFQRDRSIVHFENLCVEVSAQGYKPSRFWLSQLIGRTHDLELSAPVPTAVVKMDRLAAR